MYIDIIFHAVCQFVVRWTVWESQWRSS